MVWDSCIAFLKSWFIFPNLGAQWILLSVALALVFGAIWLFAFRPRLAGRPALGVVAVVSAFLTLLATAFVLVTMQYYYGQWLTSTFSQSTLIDWMLLWSIPTLLVYGLVQEGAKMVPVVFWWLGSGRNLEPKKAMIIGAVAGAAYGIFEAFWGLNQVFMAGWTWSAVSSGGITALFPFWEQFWMIAGNIAISAIVGYGLAKGKGFQFYLIAALLHAILLYMSILSSKGIITYNQMEIVIAVAVAIIMIVALYLRWRKEQGPVLPVEPLLTPEPPPGTSV